MNSTALPLVVLSEHFAKLPGIGMKTAQRLAYHVMSMSDEEARSFADAIINAHSTVKECSVCCNLTEDDICPVCSDDRRDREIICVVETPRDIAAIERVNEYKGLYHVLHGLISPMNGVGPDMLRIKQLIARVSSGEVKEVIMATDSTVEGEATAMYVSKLLKPFDVSVTRLASGLPNGASLEFADEVTLYKALENRSEI
ncbi:MAG: recombination protein RecR [Oscillospiraceae bacterium]|nr:recombination protein RecR [Oscillospiraceae bacterium]